MLPLWCLQSALENAVINGNIDVVKYLVERKADVNAKVSITESYGWFECLIDLTFSTAAVESADSAFYCVEERSY